MVIIFVLVHTDSMSCTYGTRRLVKSSPAPAPKGESLLDLTWHPVKPVILSVSNGLVNIWSHAQTELWSAYAPNFKELDENEDYEERERE